jgi:hypothetical protein
MSVLNTSPSPPLLSSCIGPPCLLATAFCSRSCEGDNWRGAARGACIHFLNVLLVFGFKFCCFFRFKRMPFSKVFISIATRFNATTTLHNPPQNSSSRPYTICFSNRMPLYNLFFKPHATADVVTQSPLAAYRALVCAFTWRRVLADPTIMNIIAPLFSRVICPALDAQAVPGAAGWVDLSCTACFLSV